MQVIIRVCTFILCTELNSISSSSELLLGIVNTVIKSDVTIGGDYVLAFVTSRNLLTQQRRATESNLM